ncbi:MULTISPECIES: MurR/RpiR family transcriptional regulator [Halomonas]|uniref:MurR/RpiR family transcriptional regulator n=1 Tax=Halomonas TaxID=2745 RepID=UPI001C945920|nr:MULTISPECIES: MurR/RpiR family transcriptional regulator [Halomonas]MED5296976.1 MurR/RpiR family transcriptional regulator [Pseudomonadota bacterium]MBY5926207.1 MurR/RpiR family transcriptional regulator [Halomonas sp. DP4Y7-2]MBY5931243.1 MurR/RpiR family transcriptional regulator [Halomonas sp. DP8Y7-3]MBY6030937.1 MurR/RpiR family transcriptional regulator [Halomonas sp. DP8Y7-1]MBY6209396.1 MurR/RpiR family transcriptional regulator [Halomonas sp. DP3Y7-2]
MPSSPPANAPVPRHLADLQRLAESIREGHSSLRLGRRSLAVLTALIESPQSTAVASISELAQRLDVNPSTLTRLAQRLGFDGFGELQGVFRREVADGGEHFYSDLAAKLSTDQDEGKGVARLARLGRQESANFAALLHQLEAGTYDAVVELLATGPRVRIHGQRQFASLAQFMAYGLGMLRADAAELDAGRQGVADALAQLDAGDVLVVVSCFPYTTSVLETAKVAAKAGIRIIALTDSESSPLSRVAEHRFLVPNDSLFFSNAMGAFFLLAQGLLTEVADRLGHEGLAALRRREKMIRELGASL